MVTCTNRLSICLFHFIQLCYCLHKRLEQLNITISKILTETLTHLKPFLYIFENIDNLFKCYK